MEHLKKAILALFCVVIIQVIQAQIPQVPQPPQPATLGQYPTGTFQNTSQVPRPTTLQQLRNNKAQQTRQRNQAIINEAMTHQRQRAEQQRALMAEIDNDFGTKTVRYEFPSLKNIEGANLYRNAYSEIVAMLEGRKELSIKQATFLTENAYLDNRIEKSWYDNQIESSVTLIKDALEVEGYDEQNDMAKKMMLHRFMSDTILLYSEDGGICNYSLPKTYDFHDIFGKEDWTKMFVTKLMTSKKGQCHSLPLLYLILAEELDVQAHLAYSPQHSYVKIQDSKGYWFNLELTNGYYSTDAWIVGSGYVKAEALKQDIYMKPMSKKETVASSLVDLAKGYQHKYGYDDFTIQCIDKVLEYDPKNIFALQMKADYYTLLFQYVVRQLGMPPPQQLPEYPRAYELYLQFHEMYKQIDNLGHEVMPEEVYKDWLKSLEEKKNLQAKFPRA